MPPKSVQPNIAYCEGLVACMYYTFFLKKIQNPGKNNVNFGKKKIQKVLKSEFLLQNFISNMFQ